ncbi:DGQHR domain-containing protein [Xenorhabdus bovienii]|uniref:DGQHR domain-containing protein n=1 Tax=Xenorhabdus bovienii TaxID=40576 RepID=UPI0023B2166B|nr:DGQHR domain-containing protein [Xenorhabdus bovienii]MDE9429909.1 DGQHR domain-containing protein [Xenorhabdus bovienii]
MNVFESHELTDLQPKTKQELNEEYFFEFPGIYGMQGKNRFIQLSVPFRMLKRVLACDDSGHVLDRSQREINRNRVNGIYNYLMNSRENNSDICLPPLVGNCDQNIDFQFFCNSVVGMARIPMDSVITLFDGQHRAAAIMKFADKCLDHYSIPIMMYEKLELKTRQQFFSDINNNASKPSATISMAYNGRDKLTSMVRDILKENPVLSDATDFEHNVVKSKSDYFVSFKALCDATRKFAVNGEQIAPAEEIDAVWSSWVNFSALNDIKGVVEQVQYRKEYIQFHAVMINAFGYAVRQLAQETELKKIPAMIDSFAVEIDASKREEFFFIKNWNGICARVENDRATIIASVSAQKAAAEKLADAIRRRSV